MVYVLSIRRPAVVSGIMMEINNTISSISHRPSTMTLSITYLAISGEIMPAIVSITVITSARPSRFI